MPRSPAVRAAVLGGAILGLALLFAFGFSSLCDDPTADLADLKRLAEGREPGWARREWGGVTWLVNSGDFYLAEGHANGVWLRGEARSTAYVVTPAPVEAVGWTAYSPLDGNVLTADGGGERVRVVFDTPGKRAGTPVEVAVRPVGHDVGFLADSKHEVVYRLELTTSEGWIPAVAEAGNRDGRFLSVFLSFTGGPP